MTNRKPASKAVAVRTVLLVVLASSFLLGQSNNTISPPSGWETWPLADDCITAIAMLERKADKKIADRLFQPQWYYFENGTEVKVRDDMEDGHCAWVQIAGDPKSYGWVASVLLTKPTPGRLAIIAKQKQEAAVEKDRVARANTQAAYIKTLPKLDNGNVAVFLGSDRKCSEQFVQALSMDGLEKRKKIDELVRFGCGFLEDRGARVKRIQADSNYCLVAPAEGKHEGKPGWVPCSWLK